jgi:hypothetical protein
MRIVHGTGLHGGILHENGILNWSKMVFMWWKKDRIYRILGKGRRLSGLTFSTCKSCLFFFDFDIMTKLKVMNV